MLYKHAPAQLGERRSIYVLKTFQQFMTCTILLYTLYSLQVINTNTSCIAVYVYVTTI